MTALSWQALSADYARYHRDPRNRACHMLGIPLIVFCVIRWSSVGAASLPLAALVLPLYFLWDWASALAMTALIVILWRAALPLPSWIFPVLFVLGWTLQLLGHRYEGQSPAFLRNLLHLLVGPLWILREAFVAIFLR